MGFVGAPLLLVNLASGEIVHRPAHLSKVGSGQLLKVQGNKST